MGHLGPLMKAAVGQTITVYLRNALSFPVNLKVRAVAACSCQCLEQCPMGNCTQLWSVCGQSSTGCPLPQPTNSPSCLLSPGSQVVAFEDDAASVQPGATQAYRFKVETSTGPGPNEPGAKLYLYR